MTTYERIQELSKERGLSVRELGRKLDIGETTIYKWKTQTPKLDVLEKVADYFDVSVDYLVGRTDKKLPFERWEKMYGNTVREQQSNYTIDSDKQPKLYALARRAEKFSDSKIDRISKILDLMDEEESENKTN